MLVAITGARLDSPLEVISYKCKGTEIRITPERYEFTTMSRHSKRLSDIPSKDDEVHSVSFSGSFSAEEFQSLLDSLVVSQFFDLPSELGSAATGMYEGRYYPHRIEVKSAKLCREVLWKSSPESRIDSNFENSKRYVFKSIEKYVFKMLDNTEITYKNYQ